MGTLSAKMPLKSLSMDFVVSGNFFARILMDSRRMPQHSTACFFLNISSSPNSHRYCCSAVGLFHRVLYHGQNIGKLPFLCFQKTIQSNWSRLISEISTKPKWASLKKNAKFPWNMIKIVIQKFKHQICVKKRQKYPSK